MDSTLSAVKKVILPLVLCLGRVRGELEWRGGELSTEHFEGLLTQDSQYEIPTCDRSTNAPYPRGWHPSLQPNFAILALLSGLLAKTIAN